MHWRSEASPGFCDIFRDGEKLPTEFILFYAEQFLFWRKLKFVLATVCGRREIRIVERTGREQQSNRLAEHIGSMLGTSKKCSAVLLGRHQPFPRATESQLDSECSGQEKIDLPGFDFLQVARGNFGSLGELILCQMPAHPLAANICAENFDSLPFFFGNSHDILHRGSAKIMNDTYIVKKFGFCLLNNRSSANTGVNFDS